MVAAKNSAPALKTEITSRTWRLKAAMFVVFLFFSPFLYPLSLPSVALSQEASSRPAPVSPSKDAIRPWRVIYLQAGPYRDYLMNLVGLSSALKELNLVEKAFPYLNTEAKFPDDISHDIVLSIPNHAYTADRPKRPDPLIKENIEPSQEADAAQLWTWLSKNAGGDRLIFLADGFYSADWDDVKLANIKVEIIQRLKRDEADMVIAMGTAASQAMICDDITKAVLSVSATDPIAAGLTKDKEFSGRDNVHVQVESGKLERQLTMFHNLFKFKTLGVPYDSTEEGRKTMGVETIEKVAQEKGFKIISCFTNLEIPDLEKSSANLTSCLKRLSEESEAIYLTVNNGMAPEGMANILAPIIAYGRPSFSQKGPVETRLGVLMSLAEDDFINSGRFEAKVIEQILLGQKPGNISQHYVAPLTLALNIKMAMIIGWDPPFEVLAAIDQLFDQVAGQQ